MEIVLEIEEYKDIFKNINLKIKEDAIISIIGKNNSGKSSFLNLIYGLDFEYKGNIYINQKEHNDKNNIDIRDKIFYLMDDINKQLFNINIYEDIKYVVGKVNNEALNELLNLFGLDKEILDKSYLEISESDKKKILLVIAFLSNKRIILLDNPTMFLDYKSKQSLIKLLKRNRKNKIILISSMDTNFLLSVSDRVIVIDNKKIVLYSNKYDVFENENILNELGLKQPNICSFRKKVIDKKNINLPRRDNINDLLKDVYRNAEK